MGMSWFDGFWGIFLGGLCELDYQNMTVVRFSQELYYYLSKSMNIGPKTQPIKPNTQPQPPKPKACSVCFKTQTPQNPVKCPIGPQWQVCIQCLNLQLYKMTHFKESRPRIYPQIDQITDHLYLGNEDAATDLDTIEKYQIRAICTCGSYLGTPFQNRKMDGKFSDVKYMKYQISDHYQQQIQHFFQKNCDWIEQQINQGRNVLVHCAAGVSRSASFVIAYLMKKKNMLFPDAYRYVKQRRKVIKPNSGFEKQLQSYGKSILQSKFLQKSEEQQQRQLKQYEQYLDSQKQDN